LGRSRSRTVAPSRLQEDGRIEVVFENGDAVHSIEASQDDPSSRSLASLAGAAAHLFGVVAGTKRDEGYFANALNRPGVGAFIKEAVAPDPD
jgi:hypothetical protein